MSSAGGEDPAPEVLLEAEGLGKRFETGETAIEVLADLDLRVRNGDSLAVVGQSGVGKSTFLHILGTLDHPTSGQVRFRGEDVFSKGPRELAGLRNAFLGFVFQFHHLLPEFDALENAAMPGLIAGLPPDEARARAERVLRDVELGHRLRHPVGKLSGGERQRVAVARALALDPPVLLADEPTGNLDPATGDHVADLLLAMNRDRGTTLLVVTHSERLAVRLDRTLVLEAGRLRPA